MFQKKAITSLQLDILKEIGNIGAGNATTSLSKLLNKTIEMKVPSVEVIPLIELLEVFEKYESIVAAIFFHFEGDISGSFIMTLPLDQANELIEDMVIDFGINDQHHLETEVGISVYTEIGNILTGTYLSALSDFTHLKTVLTPPELIVDMTSTIITEGLIEGATMTDEGIIIETSLVELWDDSRKQLDGHFFLLPTPQSLETIFGALVK